MVEFFRAVPVLLLMVFIWYLIGINRDGASFWAVVIALTLYNGAVLAEVLRAGVNAVPKGQREAAYAIGMRKSQVMNIVLLPQAVKIMLPAIISQCIVALKDTALGQCRAGARPDQDLQGDLPRVQQPGADDDRHRLALHRGQPGAHRARHLGAEEVRRREEALEIPMVGNLDGGRNA